MKESVFYILSMFAGVLLSSWFRFSIDFGFDIFILFVILFLIGVELGVDQGLIGNLKKLSPRILLIPIGTIVGTYSASICFYAIIPLFSIRESLLIASGFGYYSLSSSLVGSAVSGNLSLVVFFVNLFRELAVLLFAKQLKYFFGRNSLIPVSAAASDMCIPVIVSNLGDKKIFEAMFCSVILTILVPVFIQLILSLT
jgi:uncharacterized membrane protein YbjE (DUF340 family)